MVSRIGMALSERVSRTREAAGRLAAQFGPRSDDQSWIADECPVPGAPELLDRTWRLSPGGRSRPRDYAFFLPDGRLSGGIARLAAKWELTGGRLRLIDGRGTVILSFPHAARHPARGLRLLGDGPYALEQTPIPRHLSPTPVVLDWRIEPPCERRGNLVLIGANEHSLHHRWARDIAEAERGWDLGVIFYGDAAHYPPPGPCEFAVHIPKSTKFSALHAVLHEGSVLWEYQRIFLPDDDLMMSWRNITRMFALCAQHDLVLAQPALTGHSFVSHRVTRRQERFLLRFVRFVEGMAPVFTREALRIVTPTFTLSRSGWGLDHLWPKLLGEPDTGLAILDAAPITHTRPVAQNYSSFAARREMARLLTTCAIRADFTQLGGIPATGGYENDPVPGATRRC